MASKNTKPKESIDYVTEDRSSWMMNSEVCRGTLSAQIHPNSEEFKGWRITVQSHNEPKHAVTLVLYEGK